MVQRTHHKDSVKGGVFEGQGLGIEWLKGDGRFRTDLSGLRASLVVYGL
jgi:hypothetical protein